MTTFKELQTQLLKLPNKGELSDGYHTYNELYEHRMILFSIICTLIAINHGNRNYIKMERCLTIILLLE